MTFSNSKLPSIVDREGAVVLDVEHAAIVTLNSTGGYVWDRIQKDISIDDIVRDLSNDTGAIRADVDVDVRAFVKQLTAKGLLK
jgi:hypothetical protein